MKKDVADMWTDALRSGAYEKCNGRLRENAEYDPQYLTKPCRFCVLGVLCDLYAAEHADVQWIDGEFDGELVQLPRSVRDWAGMRTRSGMFLNYIDVVVMHEERGECKLREDNLIGLNDSGCPFVQIADVIAANVEVL